MNVYLCRRALAWCSMGIVAAVPAAMAGTSTTVIDNPGGGTNRIEVTGNTAKNISVKCANGKRPGAAGETSANVNSVNIDGKALQGKTVVITGRNSRDVNVNADCRGDQDGAANINSVNIR